MTRARQLQREAAVHSMAAGRLRAKARRLGAKGLPFSAAECDELALLEDKAAAMLRLSAYSNEEEA